jgi:helicase
MSTNDLSASEMVVSLSNDLGFRGEVSQIRVKALLKEISTDTSHFDWSYVIPRVVRNLTGATFILSTISRSESKLPVELESAAYRFALVWESLARLGEGVDKETSLLNAAFSYELAGYQANATCLAGRIGRNFLEKDHPRVVEVGSAFLQRSLVQVRLLCQRLLQDPGSIPPTLSALEAESVKTCAAAFSSASLFFLSGDKEVFSKSAVLFEKAESQFSRVSTIEEANLIRSVRGLLPVMRQRSTWEVLGNYAIDDPRFRRYLRLLARGPGSDIVHGRSVSEIWPSQLDALNGHLLDSQANKIIKMPTSAGKTRVAELAMVHTLVKNPGAKCVYIAPYRALVSELEPVFLNIFGDLGFRVSGVIGSYESDDFEQLLMLDADILVLTPEKLDLLQRIHPEFLNRVKLFVMDEGQILSEAERGTKFELLLTRLRRKLQNARFLFLSAVVPQETLVDFARWFNGNPEKDVMTSVWRPSIQRNAKFKWERDTGYLEYTRTEDIPLLEKYVSGVIKQQVYAFDDSGHAQTVRFPLITKTHLAAELAFKFAELGPVLVFCPEKPQTEEVANALRLRISLAKWNGQPLPSYFLDRASSNSAKVAKEWIGQAHTVTRSLESGIAVHHAGLPHAVRKSIEADFRNREIQVLVSTSTLAQGVNLPLRTVIMHSCWRWTRGGPKRVSARDYWNIAGRAGRAGEETEGTTIHIVLNDADQRDFDHYLQMKERVEPVYSSLYPYLGSLTDERLTELGDKLDPEILAMLVEEGPKLTSIDTVQEILNQSLVHTQAKERKLSTSGIARAIQRRAEQIQDRVSDVALQKIYSSTGLSTESCEMLRSYAIANKTAIEPILKSGTGEDLEIFASLILDSCLQLAEIRQKSGFGGDQHGLLRVWLQGTPIGELIDRFSSDAASPERIAKFIEDFFAYLLAWTSTAFVNISTYVVGIKHQEVSNLARFFPSMIKYGVPNPASCWALAWGISSRDLAIRVAARFSAQVGQGSFPEFAEWLGKQDSETLKHEFGLESSTAEDVTRALAKSGTNPVLRHYADTEQILPCAVRVRGTKYENKRLVAQGSKVGDVVTLVRDYGNHIDRNAVDVHLDGQSLGYIPRQIAQLMAPDIDCGLELEARVAEVRHGEVPRVWVEISKKGTFDRI